MTGPSPLERRHLVARLLAIVLTAPTMSSAMGIDGGDIFQILAVEDLDLGPTAIGIGLSLSIVSVPFQLWAARIPIDRATADLRLFFGSVAVHCCVLAGLVAIAPPGGTWAHAALAVAVTAEIALSVLWATSWQPLLTYAVDAGTRQRINSRGRAAGNVVMIAALLVFGSLGGGGRTAVLGVLAVAAVGLVVVARGLPDPPDEERDTSPGPVAAAPVQRAGPVPLLVAAGVLTMGAWPLLVTYTDRVLWPDVNLGLVAAVRFGGTVVAAVLWRPATAGLVRRSSRAALVALAGAVGVALVGTPIDDGWIGAAVLVSIGIAAAAVSTVALGLLELVHQSAGRGRAVRDLTVFDVVASTSAQVGFLVAGVLIAASARTDWPVDPYRIFLVAAALLLVAALRRVADDGT